VNFSSEDVQTSETTPIRNDVWSSKDCPPHLQLLSYRHIAETLHHEYLLRTVTCLEKISRFGLIEKISRVVG
jgi:hypothetical protein